jgi:hypothetical protein
MGDHGPSDRSRPVRRPRCPAAATGSTALGGGRGLADGRPVWLCKIYPTGDLRQVQVELTGALYPSIASMVANATCAF